MRLGLRHKADTRFFPLPMDARVGSGPSVDILLDDPGVEPEHARIRITNVGIEIDDASAAAGTFVNGFKVEKHFLTPGDEIRLGNLALGLELAREDAASRPRCGRCRAELEGSSGRSGRSSPLCSHCEMRGSPRAPSAAALDAGRALAMGPTKRLTGREAADVRKGSSRVGKVTPVPGNPSVPGYEVVAMLGEGSQGRVFKLRHATTGRIYAGKRLWEPTVKATRRFEREIEALQRLDHANIVSLVEVVRDGNNPVLVMEFVEGPSLTTIVQRQKKLDAVRGLNLARQIADGLAYASAAGVVHRDVKPSNVLVGPGDTAKLTDFGLVWFEDVRTRLTADGQWIGTPNYMAPEQVNAGPTDGRTDVWGLAATFYQVLTGALPFSAGNPLELFRHIREDEPDFERLEQAAGKPAAAVFRRFFAKELTDRPAPAEASAALSQLLLDRLA